MERASSFRRGLITALLALALAGAPALAVAQSGNLRALETLDQVRRGLQAGSCMRIPTAIDALGQLGEASEVAALQRQLAALRSGPVDLAALTSAGGALETFVLPKLGTTASGRLTSGQTLGLEPFGGLQHQQYDLVVVGAGPAGLVAAMTAKRRMYFFGRSPERARILVVEHRGMLPEGADLYDPAHVEGTAFARQQILGIRPGIVNELDDSGIIIGNQFRTSFERIGEGDSGAIQSTATAGGEWMEHVIASPPSHVVPINVLQWELYRQARDMGIEVVFDASIESLGTVKKRGVPLVVQTPGGTPVPIPIHASWIIGADGARSRVRELAGIPMEVTGDVQGAIAGVWFNGPRHGGRILFQAHEPAGRSGRILQQGDAIFGPYALPHSLGNQALDYLARQEPLPPELQRQILAHAESVARELVPPGEAHALQADRFQIAPIRLQRVATTVSADHRVILVGDAILTVNPYTTMGANAGMDTAMEAAGIIEYITNRGGDLTGTLRHYDSKHLQNARRLTEMSEGHRDKFDEPR